MTALISHAFWREDPAFTQQEAHLIDLLHEAHALSALRSNGSTVALKIGYEGSGSFIGALVSALGTLGGVHAPVSEIVRQFSAPHDEYVKWALEHVASGGKLQGWGNSFVKGKLDPKWVKVDAFMASDFPKVYAYIEAGTRVLEMGGKTVFPNPGAYTAAAAVALQMPAALSPYLFIASRLEAWAISCQ